MKKLYFPVLLVMIVSTKIYAQTNYTVSSANIPLADFRAIDKWNITQRSLLGIRANDPVNALPHSVSHEAFRLLSSRKQNCAGVFNRYGPEEEDHGHDWNFMMKIIDDFQFLYDVGFVNHSSEWPGCLNSGSPCSSDYYTNDPCMWAEIAPDFNFFANNALFSPSSDHCGEGAFLKKSDTVCVYGCFVKDDNHGNNPEIHPAQQVWFRNRQKSNSQKRSYWMMFLQDASQRFGDWVASPVYGQFLIAFKIKPAMHFSAALTVNIKPAAKKDVVTKNFAQQAFDIDDGTSHSLVVDGQKLITVNELGDDDDLGIQFTELRRLSTGEVQGYVQVSMVIGDYNTDEIGVCVLDMEIFRDQLVASPVIR